MRILVLNGHPDASPDRLCAALTGAYETGARLAGHKVRRLDVGALSFPFLHSAKEFTKIPSHPDIIAARDDMVWAQHIVFIFPLWLGGPPALLKAFMEWVACGEFLLGAGRKLIPEGKLKGRSARILVTMGMPSPIYRLFFARHGTKAFERGILKLAGIRPVRTSYIGDVEISAGTCQRWIAKAAVMGGQAL